MAQCVVRRRLLVDCIKASISASSVVCLFQGPADWCEKPNYKSSLGFKRAMPPKYF